MFRGFVYSRPSIGWKGPELLRLLITFIWIYVTYRVVRWAIIAIGAGSNRDALNDAPRPVGVNEMVKDPVCGTYVLARDATHLRTHGKTYYFCSDECRKRFINN